MNDVLKFGKKLFNASVVGATIVWSMGLAALVPTAAFAQTCPQLEPGDLFKTTGTTVYYLANDMQRMYFPHEEVFFSWGFSFNDVVTVDGNCIAAYPAKNSPAGINFRPGSKLLKLTDAPNVYAVLPGNQVAHIGSAAVAEALYGANWGSLVRDIHPFHWSNYIDTNTTWSTALPHDGQFIRTAADSTVYYVQDGTRVMVDGTGALDVRTVPDASFALLSSGSGSVTVNTVLMDPPQLGATPSTPVTGSATVSLAANTPASASVPLNATRVEMLRFVVSGTGTVSNLKVRRVGVGQASEIASVYLYEGNNRLTSARSLNSASQETTFTGLNLNLAGGSRTLSVVIDFDSTNTSSFSNHAFEITDASFLGGVTASGSFPVRGNTMYRVNSPAGTVTVEKFGNPSDPKIGEQNVSLGEFRLQVNSVEAVDVHTLTLFQVGNISSNNLNNLRLYQGGSQVATGQWIGSDRVLFSFTTPLMIDRGQSRNFDVRADIGGAARVGDTTKIYFETSADVHAVGRTYGFSVESNISALDGTTSLKYHETTIQGGDITVTFVGPSKMDIAPDTNDVELFRFSFASQNNVEVRNTAFIFDSNISLDALGEKYRNVRVVNTANNQVVVGPFDVGNGTTSHEVLSSDVWNVNAGQTLTLAVVANLANFTPSTSPQETIRVSLKEFGSNDIRNLDNNLFVDPSTIVPSANVVGSTHDVIGSGLTVSQAATPSATKVVNGTHGVAFTGLSLRASDAKDVYVKSVRLTANGADSCTTESACVLTVQLFDGQTPVGNPRSLSGTTAQIDNLNLLVPKGQTKTLTVRVNLNNLSSVGGSTTLQVGVVDADHVVVQDSQGNNVETSGTAVGPVHEIIEGGELHASLAAVDSHNEPRIVQANSSGVILGQYRFTAVDEALRVTRLTVEIPADAREEVAGVALFEGGTALTNYVAVDTAGKAVFTQSSFLANFDIAESQEKILTVRGNLNPISGAAQAGTIVTTTILDTGFEARGIGNSNTVVTTATGLPLTSGEVVIHKAVLTVTEGTLPTTVLNNASGVTLYSFSMNSSGGTASVKQMVFDVNINGNAAVASSLQLLRNGSVVTPSSLYTFLSDDGAVVTSTAIAPLTSNTERLWLVFSGEEDVTNATYQIRATLGGFDLDQTAANSIALRALTDSESDSGTIAADSDGLFEVSGDLRNFVWSDRSIVPHSTSSADWFSGYLVKGLESFSGLSLSR